MEEFRNVGDEHVWGESALEVRHFVLTVLGKDDATIADLETLVSSFTKHCRRELENGKAPKSVKRKIRDRLVVFNSIYKRFADFQPEASPTYFNKMSELLAVFITLEISTSKEGLESTTRKGRHLINEMTLILWSLLENCEDRILDTLLRLNPPQDNLSQRHVDFYSVLYSTVINRAGKRQISDLTFVRYILAVKLWDKLIKNDSELKERVLKLSAERIKPPFGYAERCSSYDVLPALPIDPCNITEFYLKCEFDVRETVETFLARMTAADDEFKMFPNSRAAPQLLNPKVVEMSVPIKLSAVNDAHVFLQTPKEELSSDEDDLWLEMHCNESDERNAESSVHELVTKMKQPFRLRNSCAGMFHVLRQFSSNNRDEERKCRLKKKLFQKKSQTPALDDDDSVVDTLPSATVPFVAVSHFTGSTSK